MGNESAAFALPFVITLMAGLSTGLGGLLALMARPTPRLLALCTGFAGGVMLTITLGDLAPATLQFYRGWLSAGGAATALLTLMLGGMVVAALLEGLLPDEEALAARVGQGQAAALRTAMAVCAALVLHNLPEGVLTLFSCQADTALGWHTALAVALHNIPEGLAVAVPFTYATGNRVKGGVAAFLSGLAEPLGAVAAWLLLRRVLTPGVLCGTVGLVSGVMLWVSAAQLLPQAFGGGRATAKAGTVGLAAGCLVMLLGIAAMP